MVLVVDYGTGIKSLIGRVLTLLPVVAKNVSKIAGATVGTIRSPPPVGLISFCTSVVQPIEGYKTFICSKMGRFKEPFCHCKELLLLPRLFVSSPIHVDFLMKTVGPISTTLHFALMKFMYLKH